MTVVLPIGLFVALVVLAIVGLRLYERRRRAWALAQMEAKEREKEAWKLKRAQQHQIKVAAAWRVHDDKLAVLFQQALAEAPTAIHRIRQDLKTDGWIVERWRIKLPYEGHRDWEITPPTTPLGAGYVAVDPKRLHKTPDDAQAWMARTIDPRAYDIAFDARGLPLPRALPAPTAPAGPLVTRRVHRGEDDVIDPADYPMARSELVSPPV